VAFLYLIITFLNKVNEIDGKKSLFYYVIKKYFTNAWWVIIIYPLLFDLYHVIKKELATTGSNTLISAYWALLSGELLLQNTRVVGYYLFICPWSVFCDSLDQIWFIR